MAIRLHNGFLIFLEIKKHFLAYAGRYIRRLPISQKHILQVTEQEVVYQVKDTRTKTMPEARSTPAEFVTLLSQHVLDRYHHSMRYFGLLAPRTKRLLSAAVFALLGQQPQPKPPRQRWAASLIKHFGVDPLIDSCGHPNEVGRAPATCSSTLNIRSQGTILKAPRTRGFLGGMRRLFRESTITAF